MSSLRRKLAAAAVPAITVGLLLSGCQKRTPKVPPAQAQAPALILPWPFPPEQQQTTAPATQPTQTTEAPAPAETESTATPASKPKAKPKHPTKLGKPAPGKVVVQEGGESPSEQQDISAAVDPSQASQQRQATEQLLQSAEANLNSLNHALSPDESAMVEQVRAYMAQSRAALNDGDMVRANNLAMKAHLLSDALTKR